MGRTRLSPNFPAKNARRVALIRKEICEGLTTEEIAELAALEAWVGAEVDRVYPLDTSALDELTAYVERRTEYRPAEEV